MYLPCLHNLCVPGQVLLATACCFTKHGALSQPASQPITTAAGAWWHGAHHCPDPLPQMAVRPAVPTPMCSPGQGWVSTQCLALSMAARKPLFLPKCQSTFRPQLLFSLPPFFSLPATGSGSGSSWSVSGFLALGSWFPHYPPLCFLSPGYKWKTAAPWSFASPSYCSQRQPGLTLHPELVLVAPPLLPK